MKDYRLFERSCKKGRFWFFSGGCTFHFVKIQCAFCLNLYNRLGFFTRISQLSFNINILATQHIKLKTPAPADIVINHYYVLFTIFFMKWIWNLHKGHFLINYVRQCYSQLDQMLFSNNAFWCGNCTLSLYQIYHFIAWLEVEISSKKLHSRKCFQEKSSDFIYTTCIDLIYQETLSMYISNYVLKLVNNI